MQHTAAKRPTPTAPTSYREQTAHRPAQHSAPETHTKITSYSGRPQRTRSVDQGLVGLVFDTAANLSRVDELEQVVSRPQYWIASGLDATLA